MIGGSAHIEAIRDMGQILGPDILTRVQDLYRDEQERFSRLQPASWSDAQYGDGDRQRLDLYAPADKLSRRPIALWVHGGGFVRGDKGGPAGAPFNAHVGRWAAREGMLGAVMNYRLAPGSTWPAGSEDVAAAVSWLRREGSALGGDPERIIVIGTSAGAVHVAGALRLDPRLPIAGAVLLSGLYGFTPLDMRDELYYGPQTAYAARMPMGSLVDTSVPLLVASAEFDPTRFQREFIGLLEARLNRHGRLCRAYVAGGHNHFSMAYHLGTADVRLANEMLSFIGDLT